MGFGCRHRGEVVRLSLLALLLFGCDGDPPPGMDAGVDAAVDAGPPPTAIERLERASSGPSQVRVVRDSSFTVRGRFVAPGATPEDAARDFLVDHGEVFGIDEAADLELREVREDERARVVIFDRVHDGRPVFGAEARVGFALDGALVSVGARLPAAVDVPAASTLDAAAATAAAHTALEASGLVGLVEEAPPVLGVWDSEVADGAPGATALAYRVLTRDGAGYVHNAWIDAIDGTVRGTRLDRYAARSREVSFCFGSDNFHECVRTPTEVLADETGVLVPATHADYDRALRVHGDLGTLYDYWQSTFGRDSFDDRGGPIRVFLRLSVGDTMWWDPYSNAIDSRNPRLETLDFFAHEFAHGVMQVETHAPSQPGDLSIWGTWMDSWGETGALGESLADTFSVFVAGDWQMNRLDGVERDLTSPARTHYLFYDERDPTPVQALYLNSSIPSLAAYLLSEGGTNPGRPSQPAIRGIGVEKVAQIWYRATRLYLLQKSRFHDFRFQALRACEDLIGHAGIELRDCGELLNAFAAVGLGGWDHDRDLWVDECPPDAPECWIVDNCRPDTTDPDLAAAFHNPIQEDSDFDRIGDLCDTDDVDAGVVERDAGGGDVDAGAVTGPCPPMMPGDSGMYALERMIGPEPNAITPDQVTWLRCRYGDGVDKSDFVVEWFHADGPVQSAACWARAPDDDGFLCATDSQARAFIDSTDANDGFEDAAERRFLTTLLAIARAEAIACPPLAPDTSACSRARITCPETHANADGTTLRLSPGSQTCPYEEADAETLGATCQYVDRTCAGSNFTLPAPSAAIHDYWYGLLWASGPGTGRSWFCREQRSDRVGATTWESDTHFARVSFVPLTLTDATIEGFARALLGSQAEPRANPCPPP